jgi:hypothetical protein
MKTWSSLILTALICVSLAAGALAQTSTAVAYKYSNLTYPGASATSANGINNGNVVVGSYVDSANGTHGFKWQNGTFTAINFPGATDTSVNGINDNGDVVGSYDIGGPSNTHAFVRRSGTFSTIDFPGGGGSAAIGINNAGTIVGNYGNSNGYVLKNGAYTTLDAPQQPGESNDTQLTGINNLGWITGRVFSGDDWRGFWYVASEFDFLKPLFSLDNTVSGSNGHGDIVGEDFATCFLSFAVESNEGSEATERYPREQALSGGCGKSINYARVIVGDQSGSGSAFLAVPVLTLNVASPVDHGTYSNPVHVVASTTGSTPAAQIQVWVNSKEVYHVSGGTLNANIKLPVGSNERFVVQAVAANGIVAKTIATITVH